MASIVITDPEGHLSSPVRRAKADAPYPRPAAAASPTDNPTNQPAASRTLPPKRTKSGLSLSFVTDDNETSQQAAAAASSRHHQGPSFLLDDPSLHSAASSPNHNQHRASAMLRDPNVNMFAVKRRQSAQYQLHQLTPSTAGTSLRGDEPSFDMGSATVDAHQNLSVDAFERQGSNHSQQSHPQEMNSFVAAHGNSFLGRSGRSNSITAPSTVAEFSDKEVRYFRKMFDMFDSDRSGAIGFFEMKNLSKHLGVELSDEALRQSMDAIDENGNGELEFDEFLDWLANVNNVETADGGDEFAVLKSRIRAQGARPLTTAQIDQFRNVFEHFDKDGSGTIDIEELEQVFLAMGQQLSREDLEAVLKQADDDGSGEIDFDEFLLLMCNNFGSETTFEEQLLKAFQRYDVHQNGLIPLSDVASMVRELVGNSMSQEEIDEVVQVAHERGDGFVEYMKWECLWDACRGCI